MDNRTEFGMKSASLMSRGVMMDCRRLYGLRANDQAFPGAGLLVLRAIRQVALNIAFVVFSNSSDPGYRKYYLDEGVENFLDKNHEFDQLAQAVMNASQHAAY